MSKTILITGSSRGIGAEVARIASVLGYKVILHGKRESKAIHNLANEIDAKFVTFDVSKENEVKEAFSSILKLDILINSAGINISKAFNDLTNEDWKQIYDVNVFGIANVARHAIPTMQKSKGLKKIVNIASVKGFYATVGRVAYASSKAAVINLTAGLAKELAPEFLVNAIAPGFTNTEMTDKTMSPRIANQINSILLGRMANANEIAELALFLVGEKNTYITGQTIIIDGGFSIKNE